MPRQEQKLMDGWEFAWGSPEEKNYRKIWLPHDWAITAPVSENMKQGAAQGFRDRWGIGWYRRTLTLSEIKPDMIYYLIFEGIYENSTVWVNGMEAGGGKYGYTRIKLDVTALLQIGENRIEVKVDNTQFPADRWYSGAGIYRTVRLEAVPINHLEEEKIRIVTGVNDGVGHVNIDLESGDDVSARLYDAGGRLAAKARGGRTLKLDVENALLWSPEEPNLYTLKLDLLTDGESTDEVSVKVGIRSFEFRQGEGFFVNGRETKIKGLCVHQDAGCLGTAVPAEIWRERLQILKNMGCNAIRTAHHIPAPEILDICDELGLMVYEECFDKWTGGAYGRYYKTEWQHDLECMVRRDRNHTCIFMWGVGNEVENQGQDSMLDILRMLKQHLLTMDDTRPVSCAMNPHFKRESNVDLSKVRDIQKFVDEADDTEIYDLDEKLERIQRIAEIVDVLCCNYQEQWYERIHEKMPDKLILGTETYQMFHGHMLQMQNYGTENPWMDVEKHSYVIGGMIWTGIDYLGESMGFPAKGWSGALMSTNNQLRPSAYLMKSYWTDEPMVYFAVMDYSFADEGVKEHWDIPRYISHWHFPQMIRSVVPYMIATNCEEVTVEVNDRTYYMKSPKECESRMISGFLPYIPGTVKVTGYIGGKAAASQTVKTPGCAAKLIFDRPEQTVTAKENYQMLLTVKAADREGNPVVRESAKVTFRVEGPAEIVAVDNGDLCGSEPYNSSFMHMYRGCVSAVIRLTGEPGRVKVTAYADGLYEGSAVIAVNSPE